MKHTIKCRIYEKGEIIHTSDGNVMIDDCLGEQGPHNLPTYRVISEDVKWVNNRPTNVFIAQIVPTLKLTQAEK